MTKPLRGSVTSTRNYLTCPRMWWLLRIPGVVKHAPGASNRGVLLHAGLAAGYAEYDRARFDKCTPGAVWRRTAAAVEYAVCQVAGTDDDIDEAIDTVIEALNRLAPKPQDRVLGVEHEMLIDFDGVQIVYRADVTYRRDGQTIVRDWKSSPEVPRARDLSDNLQLQVGALCAARTFNTTEVRGEIASIGRAVAVSAPMTAGKAREGGELVAETTLAAAADTVFEPTPGQACAECKVRRSCPLYAPDGATIPTPSPDGQSVATEVIEVPA